MTKEDILEAIALEDLVVTVSDARNYFNGCIPGWKSFAVAHGFVWVDVVRNGLLASQLMATNDSMAKELVEYVYVGRR